MTYGEVSLAILVFAVVANLILNPVPFSQTDLLLGGFIFVSGILAVIELGKR